MFKSISNSEKLLFSTIKLETKSGCGTGFFFEFNFYGKHCPVIITNKHVLNFNENEEVRICLHMSDNENKPLAKTKTKNFKLDWLFHPHGVDLCCTPLAVVLNNINDTHNEKIYYVTLKENDIPTEDDLFNLRAIEDIIMLGCPIGLYDTKNSLPLVRKGITASHPAINFNGKSIGLVDVACFPGSSGSPILIFNEGGYSTKYGDLNLRGRLFFLGILYGGPTYNTEGEIVIKELPTQQNLTVNTEIMTNLGYYIKATELNILKQAFEKKYRNQLVK